MDINKSIRIIVADDHLTMRQGLEYYLETVDDVELVGQASNGEEVVDLCAAAKPDIILMDLDMPKMDGIAATQAIHSAYPEIKVIALTSYNDIDRVQSALNAGAVGYLLKTTSLDDVANAIRAVHKGKMMLSSEATAALVESVKQPPKDAYNLTQRELEVLAHLVEGRTNVEIAEALSLSPFTVKAYVSGLLSKLGVANRSEAAVFALKHKLLDNN